MFHWNTPNLLHKILCNKLLCLTETYILYELDKHISLTNVKKNTNKEAWKYKMCGHDI